MAWRAIVRVRMSLSACPSVGPLLIQETDMSSFTSNPICSPLAGRVEVISHDDPRAGIRLPPDTIATQQSFIGPDRALLFVVGPDADPQAVARAAVKRLPGFLAEISDPTLTTLRQAAWRPETSKSASREELIAIIERAHEQLMHAIFSGMEVER